MKKNDFIIVAILVALMFAWMNYYPALEKRFFPRPETPAEQVPGPLRSDSPDVAPEAKTESRVQAAPAERTPRVQPEVPSLPERRLTLENEDIQLTVSSHGGVVVSAVLKNYPETNTPESGPVVLDFDAVQALRYEGLVVQAGELEPSQDGLIYTAVMGDDLSFVRTFRLMGDYLLTVEDSFVNSSGQVQILPELRLSSGSMTEAKGSTAMRGIITLGVDSFAPVDGVRHWGREFGKLFRTEAVGEVTTTPGMIPPRPVDWIAVKNKFFVQILTPGTAADAFDITVVREGEGKRIIPVEVSAALQFNSEPLAAYETVRRETRMYIGPKDFSFLKTQGMSQVDVMEFRSTGFWKFMNPVMYPIKTGLLWGLKGLERVVRNYGVAIMLLTIIVRIIFWPVTHKGTESMRKMQALQPQLKEIREKFKDNPQRMQKETMEFYKTNKVNPMGGCLPMIIQIPVFIALFTVLRSAIELRFSKFLWISDLSEPENLFAGMIPVAGSLNILPLLMAATMMWQQKLTPTAGDPQQQKMMAVMMPIMMLFFFYTMPSGLVLYWTTSQVLMIVQMLIKKQKPA